MKILFLITARGGSKGIPGKNIQEIHGIPLVGFKAISAKRSKYCTRLIVSTDDPGIQKVAHRYGADIPFVRPIELASDKASSADVVLHAMDYIENETNERYDAVMLLEPTSPFATYVDFDNAVDMLKENNANVVVSVRAVEIHSSKHGTLDERSRIHRPIDKMESRSYRRQDDQQEYILNGALYLFRWDFFRKHGRVMADPENTHAYVMNPFYSVEIDEMIDLAWAEFLVEKGYVDLRYWLDPTPVRHHKMCTRGTAGEGQELYKKARKIIPGGTQLLSKRPERYLPDQWPAYYTRAKGAYVWDLDGNQYLDMTTSGNGSCILGYADPDVEQAVISAIKGGSMSTFSCTEEVELAELLCALHEWADMVRFARCGGEAMTMAARIARASTGRDRIAFCGYHGWHDWYLAANLSGEHVLDGHLLSGLEPKGVPSGLAETMVPFNYNRIDELEEVADVYKDELAAIIMEPSRSRGPEPGFLEKVRDIASGCGAVLVFDEITSGWRMNTGGIHLIYSVAPDIAVFAKAISNGYPMAAVIGREAVMRDAQRSFISSTYWTERIGPSAALATIRKHRQLNLGSHLVEVGKRVQSEWEKIGQQSGLKIQISGIPPLSHLNFNYENGLAVETLFTQILLERGILASVSFYPSLAHTKELVDRYLDSVEYAFAFCSQAIEQGQVDSFLKGPVRHAGFQRLT